MICLFVCVCHWCCCFPLSLSILFNLHTAAGLIGSIFPSADQQHLGVSSASEFARLYWKLEKKINTFFMIVWTRWSCSWEISIPSGVKMSQSFPRLIAIFITWGEANFIIVVEQHKDAHSVFRVHVSGVLNLFRTLYFLFPCF